MPEIARIIDQLEREFDGEPWHGSPLTEILDDVSASQASARPIAGGHSMWELVLHIAAWKNEVRRRLGGAPSGTPDEGDWPDTGPPTEERWQSARRQLKDAHNSLLAAVSALPEAQLWAPTNDPRGEDPAGVSFYVLLHGAVQHDVYHAGQIALLRKARAAH